ncbi:Hsp70 family protein [Dactylosporangium sp. CS-033363]|uniref:Hsp70 family protein n=1 Tax=Dactylosporangium sp. CS-033363 TaxID=3239935 RepID=UPI003D94BBAD
MNDEAVLVLDIGTSTSAAALVVGDTVRLVKERSGESWVWPSVAAWDGRELLVGRRAELRRPSRPDIARIEFKRDLGANVPLRLGDAERRPEELIAALAAAIRNEAERLHGAPITRAVLTCPASYRAGDPRRELLIAAGEAAGFAVVDLLPEPVAAALAPVAGAPLAAGDTVLVYDFGGGTFDAALVRLAADSRHEVLGHAALDDCGGRDVDVLMRRELLALAGEPLTTWLTGDGSVAARARNEVEFGEFAASVKRWLSDEEEVEARFAPADLFLDVERDRLSKAVDPLVVRSLTLCRELLDRCGLRAEDLSAVLLTGGTTRMPAILAAVTQAFGDRVRRVEDPELAVAQGAAAWTRTVTDRFSVATPPGPDLRPLTWDLPGGSGTLLRWEVAPGADVAPGAVLALLRLADGGLWQLRTGDRPLRVHRLHAAAGRRIATGDWLVTAGPPGRTAHRAAGPRPVLTPPDQVFEVPSGAVRVSPAGDRAVVRTNGTVQLLRLAETAEPLWSAEVEGPHVATFAPDGSRIAVWAHDPAKGVRNVAVVLDAESGTELHRTAFEPLGVPNGATLYPLAFTDAETVVALTHYQQMTTWSPVNGATPAGRRMDGLANTNPVVVSPGAELVINGQRQLFELRNGANVGSVGDQSVNAFAWTPDGRRLAVAGSGVIRIWDVRTGERLLEIPGNGHTYGLLHVSSDGRLLAGAANEGQVWVWDLGTGALVERMLHQAVTNAELAGPNQVIALAPAQDLAFTADGAAVVFATQRTVARWNLGGLGG